MTPPVASRITSPRRLTGADLPKTQHRLLRLLVPGNDHVEIPANLRGAADGLWSNTAGHMVSIIHRGECGEIYCVRLTGRGAALRHTLNGHTYERGLEMAFSDMIAR